MNATITQKLEFGSDETFDVTVSIDRLQPHRPAHNFALPTVTDRPYRACRAWPTGEALIYVVETYPQLAILAQTILQVDGFSACAFDDRAMAWHAFAFAKPKPALLITDNLDGDLAAKDLIDRCRSIAPRLKTLLIDHRLSFDRQAPEWIDGLLPQPYCASVLLQEVRRLCADRPTELCSTR